jgi:hypothetical protein
VADFAVAWLCQLWKGRDVACINSGFLSEILPLAPEKSLFTWPATLMPHPSFLICWPGIVVIRSGSKHFRRVTIGVILL